MKRAPRLEVKAGITLPNTQSTATDPRSANLREREDETNLDDRIVPTGNSIHASQIHQQRRASSVDPLTSANSSGPGAGMMRPISSNQSVMTDAQGLIVPKKLVNPVLESIDRQNLHREMMFNQKIGKSVLNQKSELQRALEKQKERQVLAAQNLAKQTEQTIASELGRVIMQRAQRLEQQKGGSGTGPTDPTGGSINPEYLNARAKLRATVDTK
ncbi:LOW QUALITY PROTEIN: protein FAM107B [Anopheles marshallii]|uniref:LOW QUALITY PROTEIN: protein FAM107B n=1 Tax=Anopheles marshallii TaxID=1521116 RepID=UPI00237AC2C3|nr:LOW QUALITY PROTEIN: protein FAM107B [Anopheles marshallii]